MTLDEAIEEIKGVLKKILLEKEKDKTKRFEDLFDALIFLVKNSELKTMNTYVGLNIIADCWKEVTINENIR